MSLDKLPQITIISRTVISMFTITIINITSRPLYGGGSVVCVYFVYLYIVL